MADRRRSSDLSISDYVRAARFYPWAVVLPMVLIGVAAWFFLGRGADVFEGEAQVRIGTTAAQDSFDASSKDRVNDQNFKANEIKFAKGDTVLGEVAERLGDDAPDDLDDLDVSVTADEDADLLIFTAEAGSSQGAADLANLHAEVYVEQRRETAVAGYAGAITLIESELEDLRDNRVTITEGLNEVLLELAGADEESANFGRLQVERERIEAVIAPQVSSLDSQEEALIGRLSDLQISRSLAGSGTAEISSVAAPDPDPLPNAGTRALIVGELVGLVLGLMLAVSLENMNDRLRDPDEVERFFGDLPVLGTIPYEGSVRKRRELTVLAQPSSNFSESVYQVRTSLKFMTMEKGVRLVVVTSSQPSEGKTTFTANFAWALAGLKEKVVLIDGDLRRPLAHQHFGVELAPGLTDLVIDKRPLSSVEVSFEEQDGNFSIIPAGTHHGNPADFMGSQHLVSRVKEIAEDSLTVVDAAPVLPVSDARALAGASDLTIVMVRMGSSRRSDLQSAIQNLRNAGARSIALVLVGVKPESSAYYGDAENRRSNSGTAHPTPVRTRPPSRLSGSTKPLGSGSEPAKTPLPEPAAFRRSGSTEPANRQVAVGDAGAATGPTAQGQRPIGRPSSPQEQTGAGVEAKQRTGDTGANKSASGSRSAGGNQSASGNRSASGNKSAGGNGQAVGSASGSSQGAKAAESSSGGPNSRAKNSSDQSSEKPGGDNKADQAGKPQKSPGARPRNASGRSGTGRDGGSTGSTSGGSGSGGSGPRSS